MESSELLALSQRTGIQFPALTPGGSQSPVITAPGDWTPSSEPVGTCIGVDCICVLQ